MAVKYIELVGVAGVGKTTVTQLLLEASKSKSIDIKARGRVGKNLWFNIQIIFEILFILISTPGILSLYFLSPKKTFAQTKYVQKVKRDLVTRMIVDTAVIRCLLSRSTGFIINDEGLLGKLVSLSIIIDLNPVKIQTLIRKLLPMNTYLIFVSSPSIMALNRVRTRPSKLPFFDNMASDVKKNFFNDAFIKYNELSNILSSNFNIMLSIIDNSGDFNDLVDQVDVLSLKIQDLHQSHSNGEYNI